MTGRDRRRVALVMLPTLLLVVGAVIWRFAMPPPLVRAPQSRPKDSTHAPEEVFKPVPLSEYRETYRTVIRGLFDNRLEYLAGRLKLDAEPRDAIRNLFRTEADWFVERACPAGAEEPDRHFQMLYPRTQECRDRNAAIETRLKELLTPEQWLEYERWRDEKKPIWIIYKPNGLLDFSK